MIQFRNSQRSRFERNRGSALLAAMVLTLLLGSMVAVLVTTSISTTRVTDENIDFVSSFHMAERGLEEAHWELGENQDQDGDGTGTLTVSTADGQFTVSAVDLGSGLYDVTSTGTVGRHSTTIAETVRVTQSTGTAAPITVIGDLSGPPEWLFSAQTNLILDGGDGAAIILSDSDTYDDTLDQYSQALDDGYLTDTNITGGGQTGVDSIQHLDSAVGASTYDGFHADVWNYWSGQLTAFSARGTIEDSGVTVWGTAGSPVSYYFDANEVLGSAQTITGYGTLILQEDFIMESGSKIDWNGDIILLGQNGNAAGFHAMEDVELIVTGNLIVAGDFGTDVLFESKPGSQVTVDGAFATTSDTADSGTKLQFLVEGGLDITGILTLMSPLHQIEFKPSCNVLINGSVQIGLFGSQLQLKVEDSVEIVYDETAISDSLDVMTNSTPTFVMPGSSGSSGSPSVQFFGWHVVP